MSASFTLSILDADSLTQPPAHESTHPTIAAATAALEVTLRQVGTGDSFVADPTDWKVHRPVFNVFDVRGDRVGVAVIEPN